MLAYFLNYFIPKGAWSVLTDDKKAIVKTVFENLIQISISFFRGQVTP